MIETIDILFQSIRVPAYAISALGFLYMFLHNSRNRWLKLLMAVSYTNVLVASAFSIVGNQEMYLVLLRWQTMATVAIATTTCYYVYLHMRTGRWF